MGLIKVFKVEYDLERMPCLVKEHDTMYSDEITVEAPKTAFEILNDVFHPALKTEEYIYLMACDTAGHVKGLFVVSQGMVNGTLLNIQGIFTRTLLCNASKIIVAHNHPSRNCFISKEDEACCNKLKAACEIMEITLLDFMILGEWEYCSFREKYLL